MSLTVGVLALQGDFREHIATLRQIGATAIEVRTPEQLAVVDALIIPGGESTTIFKLAQAFDLVEPLRNAIRAGLPVFGTCAGLILLADSIVDGAVGQQTLGGLPVVVRRNAFGNQLDSFETDLAFEGIAGPVHAAFIRGPLIESVAHGVEVLSRLHDGRVVAAQFANLLGISFHPEVTGETRVHEYFLRMVSAAKDRI